MAKEIAIRACVAQATVAFNRPLADGERHGDVWMAFLDGGDDAAHFVIGEERVLAALQHKCPKTSGIALLETIKYLLLGQAVADRRLVASPNAAVETVVLAEIGELHEPADEDLIAELLEPQLVRMLLQCLYVLLVGIRQQPLKIVCRQAFPCLQHFNELCCDFVHSMVSQWCFG